MLKCQVNQGKCMVWFINSKKEKIYGFNSISLLSFCDLVSPYFVFFFLHKSLLLVTIYVYMNVLKSACI